MFNFWKNLSVSKKLSTVIGMMAILIGLELLALRFAMNTLSSVRAFVMGEGLWSKAQKDAVLSLYQYALTGDSQYYDIFKSSLTIPNGDHDARVALSLKKIDLESARKGFLAGGNHTDDVDGMINLLIRFSDNHYISGAVDAWMKADLVLSEIRNVAETIHRDISNGKLNSPEMGQSLRKIGTLNTRLTELENQFSFSLGAGSRWLEGILISVLTLTVLLVEFTSIFLAFRLNRNLCQSLEEMIGTMQAVGTGDFSKKSPVHSQDELGQLAMSLNNMIDQLQVNIKARETAALTVKQSEELLTLFINAVKDYAIFIVDPHGKIETWNSGAETVLGYSREEAMGNHYKMTMKEVDIENKVYETEIELAIKNGNFEKDVVRRRKSGETFWANVSMTAHYDAENNLRGFSKVVRDISAQKEYELSMESLNFELERRVDIRTRELIKAKKDADEANAMKSIFLANMSHEIRTPLSAVIGFSELQAEERLSPTERANILSIIQRNGKQLTGIIDDILDLSRVEAGKIEFSEELIVVEEFLKELEVQFRFEAEKKGLLFDLHLAGEIPNTIHSDKMRLRQIVQNVVGNAIKFTAAGSVSVKVHTTRDSNQRVYLAFTVSDTGRGMSKVQSASLFRPFVQGDTSTTREFGGSGLGLVLAREMARALGGDVILSHSILGQGSTFVCTIDPKISMPESKQSEITLHRTVAPNINDIRTLENVSVLLVEDSPDLQFLFANYLRSAGAAVELANNGKEGAEKALEKNDYDIVIMDIQMPVMDGYEAVRLLRSKGFKKPIIALTAHAMKHDLDLCLANGFDEHLGKPLDRSTLLLTVHRTIKKFQNS